MTPKDDERKPIIILIVLLTATGVLLFILFNFAMQRMAESQRSIEIITPEPGVRCVLVTTSTAVAIHCWQPEE